MGVRSFFSRASTFTHAIFFKCMLRNVWWVTQCERKQDTFTIPHFKYGEHQRFDFNSSCLYKRIKRTASPVCLSALTSEAEHLSSKEKDPLRRLAVPVPPPRWLPAGTLCSSSRRASTARWWLWRLLSLLHTSWLHTGCVLLAPHRLCSAFFLLNFSNNSHLGSWHFLWEGIKCLTSCL